MDVERNRSLCDHYYASAVGKLPPWIEAYYSHRLQVPGILGEVPGHLGQTGKMVQLSPDVLL
jgi:hypothetical protein